jgi:uncharacterized protein YlaI
MKKLAISVLCLSLSMSVFAGKQKVSEEETTPKLKHGAIIEEDLKIENKMNVYKIYGSLKDIDKNKSDKMRLQGKVYVSPCKDKSLKGYNIANIQWLGVQRMDSPDKVVGFKEPIVSSFMFKDGVDIKNIPLPTFGDEQDLIRAINDLEQDKIDLEDLKRKRKFKAVYGKPDEHASWLVNNGGTRRVNVANNVKSSATIEPGEASEMGLDENGLPNDSNNSRKSKTDVQASADSGQLNLNADGHNPANLPGFQGADGSVRKSKGDMDINLKDSSAKNDDSKKTDSPNINVELTEDGCNPEHDVLQERVIITARAKKIENGKVVDEGVCEKTLETYPVKRDYLCDDCIDEVDIGTKKAFARYQEHWFDKNGERHNLGIKVDEGHPFNIFEESRGCPFDIETEEGYAIKTSRLGYLNKFGIFLPVVGCGVSDKSEKFKVSETADGCSQLKINGNRHVQARLVIKKGNKTIEVRECRPSNIALLQDRTPCAGQYVHDFENGKSYSLAQYYYENEGQKHYVSECQKTAEYLDHQTEIKEWSNDDKNLISKPILSVYVDDEDNKVAIKEKAGENVAYEQLADQTKPTENFHYQGCYKITRTQLYNAYKRGDGSTYEKLVSEGNPIASANLCTKSIEYQTIDFINYYRNATRYPDGHSEYDAWVQY